MDNGLVQIMIDDKKIEEAVLILVVVDDGLVLLQCLCTLSISLGLNPCCSGQWPRTNDKKNIGSKGTVLILVVVDNGLVLLLCMW